MEECHLEISEEFAGNRLVIACVGRNTEEQHMNGLRSIAQSRCTLHIQDGSCVAEHFFYKANGRMDSKVRGMRKKLENDRKIADRMSLAN